MEALEERLRAVVADVRLDPDVTVVDLHRLTGGASRETYRFELHWTEGGSAHHRKMILRRDPPASLIDTERRVEFEAYRGLGYACTHQALVGAAWISPPEED